MLEDASNSPFDSESRGPARAKVLTEYHRRGFLEADLTWEAAAKKTEGTDPAVVATIKEGPVYRLRRLELIGNEHHRDRVVRRRVALNEGDPFDEDFLDLSIKRINQLGIFAEFTRENIDMKVNKKGHFVDISFRLVERP